VISQRHVHEPNCKTEMHAGYYGNYNHSDDTTSRENDVECHAQQSSWSCSSRRAQCVEHNPSGQNKLGDEAERQEPGKTRTYKVKIDRDLVQTVRRIAIKTSGELFVGREHRGRRALESNRIVTPKKDSMQCLEQSYLPRENCTGPNESEPARTKTNFLLQT